ncbi:hypothetical protein H9Y04_40685 [Streptomyces sp. TRM66268-LWL]|uniref:Uncharacterized protein n=2 Tax=Streptomyces polyasparticus TaxID=2767826 RepID=A0ABR7STR5_9ACTN|nr:hypothetical protein [Streptomyces polyasparticus]
MAGAAIVAAGAVFIRRIMMSRVILSHLSVTLVNPIFSYEIPHGAIRRAEVSQTGSLIVQPKVPRADGEDGYFVVGFAGSLIDHFRRTADQAAAEINKWQRKHRKNEGADGNIVRFIARDLISEGLLAVGIVCGFAALVLLQSWSG